METLASRINTLIVTLKHLSILGPMLKCTYIHTYTVHETVERKRQEMKQFYTIGNKSFMFNAMETYKTSNFKFYTFPHPSFSFSTAYTTHIASMV